MNRNFVIVKTGGNNTFSSKIARSIRWINEHSYFDHVFNTYIQRFDEINLAGLNPASTIIHVRAAYPSKTGWIKHLIQAQDRGFRVVNKPDVLVLTANKLQCALKLQGQVSHPKSYEYVKEKNNLGDIVQTIIRDLHAPEYIIAKPIASMEQGANVQKIRIRNNTMAEIAQSVALVPGKTILLQEFIDYKAIYRVIVINKKALPFVFVDKPEWHPDNWKVSVCLNNTTMQVIENPDIRLLALAEATQDVIGGEINFIDVFETNKGANRYTISEINTACTLNIHERLAKAAGIPEWNIHYRIAKYLVSEAMEG